LSQIEQCIPCFINTQFLFFFPFPLSIHSLPFLLFSSAAPSLQFSNTPLSSKHYPLLSTPSLSATPLATPHSLMWSLFLYLSLSLSLSLSLLCDSIFFFILPSPLSFSLQSFFDLKVWRLCKPHIIEFDLPLQRLITMVKLWLQSDQRECKMGGEERTKGEC